MEWHFVMNVSPFLFSSQININISNEGRIEGRYEQIQYGDCERQNGPNIIDIIGRIVVLSHMKATISPKT